MPYAVTFTSADGFEQTFALDWLLEHNALVATCVGGEPLSESFGGANQLWLSGAAARLFVRDIVSIRFDEVGESPAPPSFEADGMLFQNRPNVGARATGGPAPGLEGARAYPLASEVALDGWAYDFDRRIAAIEFSLDQGETWSRYGTPGTDANRWVRWTFAYAPQAAGRYELWVRSVNDEGAASPEAARYSFDVRG